MSTAESMQLNVRFRAYHVRARLSPINEPGFPLNGIKHGGGMNNNGLVDGFRPQLVCANP